MKESIPNRTSFPRNLASVFAASLALASTALAIIPVPTAPQPMLWKTIADTCSFANSYHSTPGVTLTRFTNIDPPVLAQKSPDIYAFRASIQTGITATGLVVNLGSNQGIWGNGGPLSQGLPTSLTPWLIAREGDPVPSSPGLLGRLNAFNVRALQVNAAGQTYATVNIDAPGTGSAYLMDNCCLQTLAASGPGAPYVYQSLQSVVTSSFGNQVAGWARDFTPRSGTMEWLPPAGMLPCAAVPFGNISWQGTPAVPGGSGLYRPIPTRVASPAISERGIVAHHAVDSILPIVNRPHIRVDRNTAVPGVVVRSGWATGGGDFFGNFHTNLLAVCDNPAPMHYTVAWQMQDLRATPAGAPITGSNSLWAKCATGPFHRIAQVGQPALDVPAGNFYASFHALHVIGKATTTGDSLVIFGVRLMGVNAGKTVIYSAPITAGGTVLGPYTRIATDVPGACNVNPILTGADTIATLFPFFSTNTEGDVLIKATLASAPVANRQVIISALAATGHPLTVRSQSGMPITPGACTSAATITNFIIANPEQGTYSRGQAISSMQGIGARVNFTGGHGAFIGF